MTQTLSPNDSGEIHIDPGMTAQNLAPYAAGLPPAMRRPGATGELPLLTWPPKRPAPNVEQLIEQASAELVAAKPVVFLGEHTPGYVGRHRRRNLWQRLTGGAR